MTLNNTITFLLWPILAAVILTVLAAAFVVIWPQLLFKDLTK